MVRSPSIPFFVRSGILALSLLVLTGCHTLQREATPETVVLEGKVIEVSPKKFPPTYRDLAYGPHERNKLDFWQAASDTPTPVVFYIHGGGWVGGSKESNKGPYLELLDEGVSYVSINYRLARDGNVLPCSLLDAARALQFVRSKAKEWNIDPERIVATGGSAGGCSSLWLAFHEDLADPTSDDPVARESTRVSGAAVINAQTTIDPRIVDARLGYSASKHRMIWTTVGASSREDLLENYERYEPLFRECSPLTHLSSDDPPVLLVYAEDTPARVQRHSPCRIWPDSSGTGRQDWTPTKDGLSRPIQPRSRDRRLHPGTALKIDRKNQPPIKPAQIC